MTRALQTGAALFAGAALAFAFSAYALGVWLAVGCAAVAAWVVSADLRADRPGTVRAIEDATARADAAFAAIDARLAGIEAKSTFLTASFSSAFPARQQGAPMRSPIRPPNGTR